MQASIPKPLVVADAGPLMAMGRHNLLDLLAMVFERVMVPRTVLRECLHHPQLEDAQRIRHAVGVGTLSVVNDVPMVITELDAGECAAIGCALKHSAVLLVDDLAARRHAQAIGLQVIGTLGVLVLAKRRGFIARVEPLVSAMREGGHYISDAAFKSVLNAAGESGS